MKKTKTYYLKATFSENVNKVFRVETRLYHHFNKFANPKNYPIIINNFNRFQYLKQQVEWLHNCGLHNIHVIDNASSFPPLLEYYKVIPATVYMLDRNIGHEALWRTHLYQRFGKYFHVYTDSDLLPTNDTPIDFMQHFKNILDKYPSKKKVGFGLAIHDLPIHYARKKEVIDGEKQFTIDEIEPGIFESKIDTTFALYRPGAFKQCWEETLRTGAPYLLKHMPWYENSKEMSEESLFYEKSASSSSSWYRPNNGN